ncbi:MAG: DUF4163 domain-containing protein [Flavobacteriaceae bacterium]|nr:DUF3298 and DUF4163 domain-containing protein [Bacteroidia bacterium]NNK82825.1 DUF4163 domain-containing protein [Flavobacteriaceae bacterium]
MKRFFGLFFLLISLNTCEEEPQLVFTESNQLYQEHATIEINIPVAKGDSEIAKTINSKVENHIANMLIFSEEDSNTVTLDEGISKFDAEYKNFKADFEESNLIWEATFDAEVLYQSSNIISIAISSYTNTGGAHGNSVITFYNFDIASGNILDNKDIINDLESFAKIAEEHFKNDVDLKENESIDDFFFGEPFHLPANIGFNEEGLVLLYNTYEVASYAMGITEFTIPFEDIDTLLVIK